MTAAAGSAAVLALVVAAPASAAAPRGSSPHQLCAPVAATGVGQDLGGGRTTATISTHGVTLGTTTGSFTITGVTGSIAAFSGPIVFALPGGTVTAPVTGTLDTTTGDFRSASSTLKGTGIYALVAGSLVVRGHEDLTSGSFTETLSATLCVPVHRH